MFDDRKNSQFSFTFFQKINESYKNLLFIKKLSDFTNDHCQFNPIQD